MNKSQIIVNSKRKKPLPVVILIGQSNAVGVGTIASAPSQYQGTIANTQIWNGSSFVNLVAGSTNQGADALTFGPELSLCTQFLTRTSASRMYLIKHAVTNTSLNGDWLPTASTQYTNMITKINNAISALVGVRFYIAGFVWVQGENDALSASATPSTNYQTNLTSLITNPSQIVASNAGTIFLVQKYAVDKAASSMFISAGTNSVLQIVNKWYVSGTFDSIFWDFANQSTGRIYGTAPAGITGNWKVTEFVKRAAGNSEVYVGGTSALSGSTSGSMASATGTFRIGSDGSNYFNGQIAEIICYNKELTSGERTAVYNYINVKYGL